MTKNNRDKARRVVSRHTTHGLNRSTAKLHRVIASLGTERSYRQGVVNYYHWCDFNGIHPDFHSNINVLKQYIEERSELVVQKTLDQERQALQCIYKQVLPYVRAQQISIFEKRSYTLKQLNAITSHQTEKNLITSQLAFYSGLRAHESAMILPLEERLPSAHRSWDARRFLGCPEYRLYTVVGKGGLIREVAVPLWLSKRLETRRTPPTKVTDRGIFYESLYDIGFGQSWSQSFTTASRKALKYSTGGHGLRHSYAKHRLYRLIEELECHLEKIDQNRINEIALLILSQELGHFRLEIVFAYLR